MVNYDVFIKAAAITVVLLMFSLMVGNYIEGIAYSKISDEIVAINEDQEALLILQSFSTENDTDKICNVIESQIDTINGKIYVLREALESQKSTSVLKDYDVVRRQYFIANARLLSLTKQYQTKCGGSQQIMLFFYNSQIDCPECYAQGRIIDEVRAKCPSLRVFSFPSDIDMPMINSFMSYYGVTKSPSVVIDAPEDVVFGDTTGASRIMAEINCTG